jgi:hypothetical protein
VHSEPIAIRAIKRYKAQVDGTKELTIQTTASPFGYPDNSMSDDVPVKDVEMGGGHFGGGGASDSWDSDSNSDSSDSSSSDSSSSSCSSCSSE